MEKEHQELSVRRQCEILSLNRSSLYYERIGLSEEDQRILDEMDKIYLDFPIYGFKVIHIEEAAKSICIIQEALKPVRS